jgi:hypothetical protein
LSSGAHSGETAAAAEEEEEERITYLSTQRHKNWSPPFKHGSWTVIYLTREILSSHKIIANSSHVNIKGKEEEEET